MTVNPYDIDAAARYDKALHLSQKRYPPPAGVISPKPTKYWPEKNITLLREYQRWLLDGGASHNCTLNISIPTAGHVLGLSLKSHEELCLEQDIKRALGYIEAREMSAVWTTNCRRALHRFRRYLQLKRGEITFSPYPRFDLGRYTTGLPPWLVEHLDQIRIVRQGNWRRTRLHQALIIFWRTHTQLWRWLFENDIISAEEGPEGVCQIRRQHLYAFIDARMANGMSSKTINLEMRTFQATLRFLQEHDILVPQSILAMRG
ncbi:MAG: hypothetical protein QNJ45_25320, partial [Ardenticatenaceae bacterium]|nr:hypothetical protein [Ardenticatenaceae bacterium]